MNDLLQETLWRAGSAVRRYLGGRRIVAGAVSGLALLFVFVGVLLSGRQTGDVVVRRGSLDCSVPMVGTLVASHSDSYGAAVPGVELKILWLAEEGTLIAEGDRLILFDSSPFVKELETARARAAELAGEADQARLASESLKLKARAELQGRRASAEDSQRGLSALVNTGAPLSAQESAHEIEQRERILKDAEAKLGGLEPFLAEGYISQEEYRSAVSRRDQAAADLKLARARHAALVHQTNPDIIRKKSREAESDRLQLALETQRARVEMAHAEAAVRVASARLEEANRQASEAQKKIAACTVAAKAPGLVVHAEIYDRAGARRKIRVGDSVWGGTSVAMLPDLTRMQVEGSVPESDIHLLAAGQAVRVRLDAFPDLALTGALRAIGSVGISEKNESRTFPATIVLHGADPRFRPGMVARCAIGCGQIKDALVVPTDAIHIGEKGAYALVVSALGKASRRRVVTGLTTSQLVEIRQGLSEGETVRIAGE